jgi:hypothetical protein
MNEINAGRRLGQQKMAKRRPSIDKRDPGGTVENA